MREMSPKSSHADNEVPTREPTMGSLWGQDGGRDAADTYRRPAQTAPPNRDRLGTKAQALELEPDQCWTRLQQSRTGRIVVSAGGLIEIRPVNYVANGRTIVFATSSSILITAAREHEDVTFEVDEHDGWTAWSVVLRGHASITDDSVPPHGQDLHSMLATVKTTRIKITPTEVTGRLFDQQPWQDVGPGQSGEPEQEHSDTRDQRDARNGPDPGVAAR
jgi:nitroimidazol reductase NimA-like FMN-containing flavoprotein (pyridoxamine 5'-phosphate oxidase superfamily)